MLTRVKNLISSLKDRSTPDRETLRRNGFHTLAAWEDALQAAKNGDFVCLLRGIPPVYHQEVVAALGVSGDIKPPPKNWTREWVEANPQVVQEVATLVHRRAPMETFQYVLSLTGEWIAQWCAKDQYQSLVQETGVIPVGLMASYVVQKHWVSMSLEGQDAIGRMYGRLTQTEVRKGRRASQNPLAHRVVLDMAENEGSFEVFCEGEYNSLDAHTLKAAALNQVQKTFRKPLYAEVASDLLNSFGRQEIADRHQITPQQASQIISRVRGAMREAL